MAAEIFTVRSVIGSVFIIFIFNSGNPTYHKIFQFLAGPFGVPGTLPPSHKVELCEINYREESRAGLQFVLTFIKVFVIRFVSTRAKKPLIIGSVDSRYQAADKL